MCFSIWEVFTTRENSTFSGKPESSEIEPKTDYHGSPLLQYFSIYLELKYGTVQTHPEVEPTGGRYLTKQIIMKLLILVSFFSVFIAVVFSRKCNFLKSRLQEYKNKVLIKKLSWGQKSSLDKKKSLGHYISIFEGTYSLY